MSRPQLLQLQRQIARDQVFSFWDLTPFDVAPWGVLPLRVAGLSSVVREPLNEKHHAPFAPQKSLNGSWGFLGAMAHPVNGTRPWIMEIQALECAEGAELMLNKSAGRR